MNNKTKDVILLAISGVFLIVASVCVTYTIMNYISFKAKVDAAGGDTEVVIKENKKKPLTNDEIGEFSQSMNTPLMGSFLSSVTFLALEDLKISNANLIKYVYPLFDRCDKTNLEAVTISKDDFLIETYNLAGMQLDDATIENSALWNSEMGVISFAADSKEMTANIKIDSSYKIDEDYYFDIDIDNNVYGLMKRSVALKRNDTNKYTFIYIKEF